jgi:lysophospholipase L1-like esterase
MKIIAHTLKNISLAAAGVLVALLLTEGYLRLFTPADLAYSLEWRSKAGQYASVKPKYRRTGPFRPNASVNIWGITYAINSDGFRDYDRYSRKKPPGVFRIMAVGDSYTFGMGVELEDTYPKKLEKLLNERRPSPLYRYEVINAGFPAANAAMEVDFVKEYGMTYNPDLVLIGFVLNDLEEPWGTKRPPCLPIPEGARQWLDMNSYLYLVLENRCTTILRPNDVTPEWQFDAATQEWQFDESSQGWQDWARVVEYNGQVAREAGPKTLVAIFPQQVGLNHYHYTTAHRQVKDTFERAGVPVVDLLPGYQDYARAHGVDSFAVLPFDTHPNPTGHQIAAEIIYQALIEDNLIRGS